LRKKERLTGLKTRHYKRASSREGKASPPEGVSYRAWTLIVGMGVDIAEVGRIQGAIERHGEVFLRRIYTTREREYCERFKNKYERYAGRFAAKEAAMKALGTGWRRGVRWVDLEVVRETSGRPTLSISGEAAKIAQQLGVKSVALSITHTESQALAQVIFEG
jgi:holo-[acyl-carrier protein] synthase